MTLNQHRLCNSRRFWNSTYRYAMDGQDIGVNRAGGGYKWCWALVSVAAMVNLIWKGGAQQPMALFGTFFHVQRFLIIEQILLRSLHFLLLFANLGIGNWMVVQKFKIILTNRYTGSWWWNTKILVFGLNSLRSSQITILDSPPRIQNDNIGAFGKTCQSNICVGYNFTWYFFAE